MLPDENFNKKIAKGLRAQQPDIGIIRIQDTEPSGTDDPDILDWAAQHGPIWLTHDWDTMTKYANERLAKGYPLAEVIFVHNTLPIGTVIEDLLEILVPSKLGE